MENLRFGGPDPSLSVDWAELRFAWPELLRGELQRLRVQGVVLPACWDGAKLVVPLVERCRPLLESGEAGRLPSGSRKPSLSVGELSAYGILTPVCMPGGDGLVTLETDVGAVLEPSVGVGRETPWSRYRLWARVSDGEGTRVEASGFVLPSEGAISLSPVVSIPRVERWVARAVRAAPELSSRMTAWPTNCSAVARGTFSVAEWSRLDTFEVAAELGRGSRFDLTKPAGWLRLQTLRVEATGTPADLQARFSAGVAGFSFEGQGEPVSQDAGRLLSMRGTAHFSRTLTNRVVSATIDSDMPGRSAAKVIPRILPLLPRLLTEGGTLHAEASLEQPVCGAWQGDVRVAAEARRNALTLPAGRLGASRVSVEGRLAILDAKPGELRTDVSLEDGYFFRPGVSLRANARLSLVSSPPYRSAEGSFSGALAETATLRKYGLPTGDEALRMEGRASVTGLLSNPVWQVSLNVPEVGVGGSGQGVPWRAIVGASAEGTLAATRIDMAGAVWARDLGADITGGVGRIEAGLTNAVARFRVSGKDPSDPQSLRIEGAVAACGGHARAGAALALEAAEAAVPLSWTKEAGLRFGDACRLSWKRFDAGGLELQAGSLVLKSEDGAAQGSFDMALGGSALRAVATARVPFARPGDLAVDVAVPDVRIGEGDAVAAVLHDKSGFSFSGRVGADAKLRLLGDQPHVLGSVRLAEGSVDNGKMAVAGLSANVPFESSVFFRTIERPWLSFSSAKAGNVRLGEGRMSFQITPEEVYVDRVEVGWCKGSLSAYSVHLPYVRPQSDFVIYADRIDLGEALMMVMPMKGLVEGVLYGRIPVGIDGGHVRLSTGFLYSLPGQGGKLRLDDSRQMAALLDQAGIRGDVQAPLSRALSDVDFSAVKMELEPGQRAGEDGVLRIKLNGKSNDKAWPAPVDLNLNLHAPLEELVNMGLDLSRK